MEDKFSEADLCQEFRAWLESRGLIVHPEVSDWDLVVVGPPGWLDGGWNHDRVFKVDRGQFVPNAQIGVQAKLVANVDVLHQALETSPGTVLRCVLVRRASPEFITLADRLGLAVAVREVRRRVWGRNKDWERAADGFYITGTMKPFPVRKPLWLPPVVTNLVAGGPSPKQLTKWRVGAIKLCSLLKTQGYLTTADFKSMGINPARWKNVWIVASPEKILYGNNTRALTKYIIKPGAVLPDEGWDEVAATITKESQ